MIYLGIDPSYTNTGVVILDTDNKTIKFLGISPPGTNDSYGMMLNRSAYVSVNILRHLPLDKQIKSVMEEPLLTSQRASTLGVLSAGVSWSLAYVGSVTDMYSVNPRYVSSLVSPTAKKLGINKKQAGKYIVERLLEYYVERKGYTVIIHNDKTNKDGSMRKRVLSHDEADAFLLLTTLLRECGEVGDADMRYFGDHTRKFYNDPNINKFM